MQEESPGHSLTPSPSIFDGWRSISVALYMTLVGYGVLVGIPVISTAWVELLGFSMGAMAAVPGMLIYTAMYIWLRKRIPALADAS